MQKKLLKIETEQIVEQRFPPAVVHLLLDCTKISVILDMILADVEDGKAPFLHPGRN